MLLSVINIDQQTISITIYKEWTKYVRIRMITNHECRKFSNKREWLLKAMVTDRTADVITSGLRQGVYDK